VSARAYPVYEAPAHAERAAAAVKTVIAIGVDLCDRDWTDGGFAPPDYESSIKI
jgi:hypothetical protein